MSSFEALRAAIDKRLEELASVDLHALTDDEVDELIRSVDRDLAKIDAVCDLLVTELARRATS